MPTRSFDAAGLRRVPHAFVVACVCALVLQAAAIASGSPPVYPLRASANGRYLVDQSGVPFLIVGDSPQGLIARLSLAEAEIYFANREAKGINVVQIHLLAGPTFGGRGDFSTADGITPFTTNGDLSTPREAYFARVDAILALANTHHMTVMLTAAETIDALVLFGANGTTKSRAFGRYLGARYASKPNLIWDYGNDFQTWRTASDNAVILAVCDGIKDFDSSHIHTIWLDYLRSASRDSTDWDSRIALDFAYTYYPPYELILTEYAKAPAKPVFMGESNYEGEALRGYLTTPFVVRKQNYWSLLSGATGTFYCNNTTWGFPSGWQAGLESTGVNELAHLNSLFGAYPWWTLVPDTAHTALTAGYGTYAAGTSGSIDTNDYVTAARAPDGSLLIAYLPVARAVTINMSTFARTVTARWYDPTNGAYSAIAGSPFSNSGSRNFSPAATNASGAGDWVLVLQTAGAAAVSDFTGDAKGDILWRHATLGEVWLWPMDGAGRTAETYLQTVPDTNWEIRGIGDQNGDGYADILWRNKVTGAIYYWAMHGSTRLAETYVATVDPGYDIVGTGDFNGDGKSDVLWRNLTNQEVWIWLMDGATPLSEVYVDRVDAGYAVEGVGDFDGDGKADIVWHHGTRGDVWVWLMNGTTRLSAAWVGTVPDVAYHIVGVADFTGDGRADILWHHATAGEVWLWPMAGTTRLAETYVARVPDTAYHVAGTADYDGDGRADILWHHAARGEVWVWLMNGATRLSQSWVATVPDLAYQIVR
jgi:hypothetical protein